MTDIALRWSNGAGDGVVRNADLLAEEGLLTAVELSLFSHARASDSDVLPDGETSRRGWWGDQFSPFDHDNTGSKLWLLCREKRVQETLSRAKAYCEEALAWFVSDGVASAVEIETSFVSLKDLIGGDASEYAMVIEGALGKPDGTRESFRYAYQWEQQMLIGAGNGI